MLYFKIDYDGNPDPSTGDQGGDYTATNPPFWDNNSLWLVGGPSQTSVKVGNQVQVKTRVTNNGENQLGAVHIQAWVFQPFVGLAQPGQAITALQETNGLPDGSLITFSGSLANLAHGSGADVPDPHVAIASTPSGTGYWGASQKELDTYGGHLCLVANVYTSQEGKLLNTEDYFATTSYVDSNGVTQPRDGHHGQRNIALLPSAQPQQVMPFQVHPPLLQGQPTLLDIHALGSVGIGAGEHWLLQSRANVTKIDNRKFVIPGVRGKPATPLTYSRKGLQGSLSLDRFGTIDLAEATKATREATRRAGEMTRVPFQKRQDGARIRLESLAEPHTATITLQRDDAKGSMQAFDIVQRTEDGKILGGLRMLSLVTG